MAGVLDSFRLDGRVGLVTGAGSGIGRACAEALAEAGADVACADIDLDAAEATAEWVRGFGARGHAVHVDVADEAAVEAGFAEAEEALGPVDVAFANAGIAGEAASLGEYPTPGWREVLDVNLSGAFFTARAAGRRMAPRGYGKIVFTGSLYSHRGDRYFGVYGYAAAKSGLLGVMRTAALDLGPKGVRVNAIVPGWIRTQIAGGHMYSQEPEDVAFREQLVERLPLRRVGEADDVKGTAVFLASAASDYVTGWTFPVDGGWLAA
ncbi:MAG TPA: SDR family oxidoreductase [Solirubrobacteraceae bacterium]